MLRVRFLKKKQFYDGSNLLPELCMYVKNEHASLPWDFLLNIMIGYKPEFKHSNFKLQAKTALHSKCRAVAFSYKCKCSSIYCKYK